ncbi:hypothetical protein ACR9GP_24670 [Enterobacter ludwigii]
MAQRTEFSFQTPTFCPVTECSECDDYCCRHNPTREKRIAAAQTEYEQAQRNLRLKEKALITIIKGEH